MSDDKLIIEYTTLNGVQRRVEYKPIPGSAHWNLTHKKRENDEWTVDGSAEVKRVRAVSYDTEEDTD